MQFNKIMFFEYKIYDYLISSFDQIQNGPERTYGVNNRSGSFTPKDQESRSIITTKIKGWELSDSRAMHENSLLDKRVRLR